MGGFSRRVKQEKLMHVNNITSDTFNRTIIQKQSLFLENGYMFRHTLRHRKANKNVQENASCTIINWQYVDRDFILTVI